jgi:hypothetical protein
MSSTKLSAEVHGDLDPLVATYLDATFTILQKDKYISPMGMILEISGESRFVGLLPKDEKNVDMAAHLDAYRQLLKQQMEGNKASLLGYDVKIHDPEYNDAICIELHHKSGAKIKLLVPYKFSGLRKQLNTGEIQRVE